MRQLPAQLDLGTDLIDLLAPCVISGVVGELGPRIRNEGRSRDGELPFDADSVAKAIRAGSAYVAQLDARAVLEPDVVWQFGAHRHLKQDAVLRALARVASDVPLVPVAHAHPEISFPLPVGLAQARAQQRHERVIQVDAHLALGRVLRRVARHVGEQEHPCHVGELQIRVEFRRERVVPRVPSLSASACTGGVAERAEQTNPEQPPCVHPRPGRHGSGAGAPCGLEPCG